jgi:hypothetical protein
MIRVDTNTHRRSALLVEIAIVTAVVAAACGSSSATTVPGASGNGTLNTGQTPAAGQTGAAGLGGAVAQLSSISSFKFSMSVLGGDLGSALASLTGGADTGTPITVAGTIEDKPDKAFDITVVGIHMIGIGGFTYTDVGIGSFMKAPATGQSIADTLSPGSLFGPAITANNVSGYTSAGTETKNNVATTHYVAGAAALADLSGSFGATAATWSADVWVANDGGYPVSMNILGKAKDGSTAFQLTLDLTNINDPGNKITAPAN